MNTTTILILLIVAIAIIIFLYFIIKPYTIKYDTTLAFTGGLGAGKTLNAVKIAITQWKKVYYTTKWRNKWNKWRNKQITKQNKKRTQKGKKIKPLKELEPLPWIYSNLPICMNKKKNIWSREITKEHLLLQQRITKGSIVLIDEFPQMINQFNWNIKEVQNNVNEFITFFRHYIQGKFIITAQSLDDVVAQVRRKLNTYYWLFDFQKFLFIFYKVRICSLQTSEMITSTSSTFIEENTKWKYGIILKKYYDPKAYSERYNKVTKINNKKYTKYKTNNIIRFSEYKSPLDEK